MAPSAMREPVIRMVRRAWKKLSAMQKSGLTQDFVKMPKAPSKIGNQSTGSRATKKVLLRSLKCRPS